MSTDRQRLQSAIQRIAKQDPDLSALIGASKNRGGQAESSGIGTSDAERDNLCCDGTEGAGANAGSDATDPADGGQDGLNSDDPALLDNGPGSLTGITDCATGQPICFDGDDFVPPDGWDSPTESPYLIEEDKFWRLKKSQDVTFHRTKQQARDEVFDGGAVNCETTTDDENGLSGKFTLTGCDTAFVFTYSASRLDCDPPLTEEQESICNGEQDPEEFWPEDGCTNLAISGGKIVGSKYDPENDGSYSAPRDELEVCDADGDRILLRGSPTGGWKSIKSLSGDIDPDAENGYLYRPNGQRVRQISPSEFRDDTV